MRDKIINMLGEISRLYEVKNEKWRAGAYHKAITSIKNYNGKLPSTIESWCDLPSIGEGIASKIVEFQNTGSVKRLLELRKDAPPDSVSEFMDIPGVGMKKAKEIFSKYKVKNLKSLFDLYESGKIKESWLNKGLKTLKERGKSKRIPLYLALQIIEAPLKELRNLPFVLAAIPAGSIRRMKPTVKDFDIILCVKNSLPIEKAVRKICKKYRLEDRGGAKCYIPVGEGRFIDLYFCHEKNFGTMLLYLTGSGEWGAWIRSIVKKKGGRLNQYCLEIKGKKYYYDDEEKLLKKILGVYVPPECRERPGDTGKDVISFDDIKGDFHIHTTRSDGNSTPKEVGIIAKKLGYGFVGLADHVGYMPWSMNGVDFNKWISVFEENKSKLPVKGLIGAEIDVSKKGKISIDKKTAKRLDFICISSHQQPGIDLLERYTSAMKFFEGYKGIKILSHPINRNLQKGVMTQWNDVPWPSIFKMAKETNTYLEVNGAPERLDLDWELIRLAKSMGCKFVLSSDAHSNEQIEYCMYWAVQMARKGLLTRKDILNYTYKF